MHLYLDSAELSVLLQFLPHPVVYGVTTNPSLQREAGLRDSELEKFVGRVLGLGARAVQVQVKHRDAAGMIADAKRFVSWAEPGRVVPKLPVTREGLLAATEMRAQGISFTLTAVYQLEQVMWALLAGARYAAPYLGRINDRGKDGLAVVAGMQGLLQRYGGPVRGETASDETGRSRDGRDQAGSDLRLLVASVRTARDFRDLLALGVGAITVRPALFADLLDNDYTLRAEQDFLADAEALRL